MNPLGYVLIFLQAFSPVTEHAIGHEGFTPEPAVQWFPTEEACKAEIDKRNSGKIFYLGNVYYSYPGDQPEQMFCVELKP